MTVRDTDAGMHALIGTRAEGECAFDADTEQCLLPPSWRLTVLDELSDGTHAEWRNPRTWVEPPERVRATWLVCSPHLGHALILTDEVYGTGVLVEVHHG